MLLSGITAMTKIIGKYTNGNVLTTIWDDGTKIRYTKDDEFHPEFPENMDIKITNKCTGTNCQWCHEGSNKDGLNADILHEPFIDTLHPFQEAAIGGGNVFEHPDLIPFLEKLKDKKVIANITVNQIHFMQHLKELHEMTDKKLIYGLGVSLVNPTDEFISAVKEFPNAVIHVINGIITEGQIDRLANHDLKLLILGYKILRRGKDYIGDNMHLVMMNQMMLKNKIQSMISQFKVVSFDNLAVIQLDVKELMTQEKWNEFYQGDDGTFTFYIDMVNRKFATSSTEPLESRKPLMDNVDDMFRKIQNDKLIESCKGQR